MPRKVPLCERRQLAETLAAPMQTAHLTPHSLQFPSDVFIGLQLTILSCQTQSTDLGRFFLSWCWRVVPLAPDRPLTSAPAPPFLCVMASVTSTQGSPRSPSARVGWVPLTLSYVPRSPGCLFLKELSEAVLVYWSSFSPVGSFLEPHTDRSPMGLCLSSTLQNWSV